MPGPLGYTSDCFAQAGQQTIESRPQPSLLLQSARPALTSALLLALQSGYDSSVPQQVTEVLLQPSSQSLGFLCTQANTQWEAHLPPQGPQMGFQIQDPSLPSPLPFLLGWTDTQHRALCLLGPSQAQISPTLLLGMLPAPLPPRLGETHTGNNH